MKEITIKKYLNKVLILKSLYFFIRFLITTINIVFGFFIFSVLLDEIVILPIFFFHIYWFFILGVIFIIFLNFLYRILEIKINFKEFLKELANKLNFEKQDDILNALIFEEKLKFKKLNFSYQLTEKFVDNVKEKLIKVSPVDITDLKNILKVLPLNLALIGLFFILYALPPYVIKENVYKILFTRKPEILGIFILPGNQKIPYNSECEIKIVVEKKYAKFKPRLFIKYEHSSKFIEVDFSNMQEFLNKNVYRYKINSLKEKLYYRIKFRGVNSKTFLIEPIIYPEVAELKILVAPPKYTEIKEYEVLSFNETKYLVGSNLKIYGKTNKEVSTISLISSEGFKSKLFIDKDAKTFYGEYKVKRNTEIWFEIFDKEGLQNVEKVRYKIFIIEDEPPIINIVSPQDEIMVEPTSELPIIYSVKDDIGISKVILTYVINETKKGKFTIMEYKKLTKEDFQEFVLDLSKFDLNYDDKLDVNFIVYDNDIIFGPKYSVSETIKIEIFSYEKQYNFIIRKIEEFNEKTLELLAKQIQFKKELLETSTEQISKNLIDKQINTKKDFSKLKEMSFDILELMSNNPYISFDTYFEFKKLSSSTKELEEEILDKFLERLKENKLNEALDLQNQIIDSLERFLALNSELLKKQKMLSISKTLENLKDYTQKTLETIKEGNSSLDKYKKVEELVKKIKEKLKEISEKIAQMNELPEEFVNKKNIRNLDFFSVYQFIEKIEKDIKSNNLSNLEGSLENLLKELEKISKIFGDESHNVSYLYNFSLNESVKSLLEKLDDIINRQNDIYLQTKQLDDFKLQKVIEYQQNNIPLIKKRLEKIKVKIEILNNNIKKNLKYEISYAKIIERLKDIFEETEKNKLIRTSEYLKEIKILFIDFKNDLYMREISNEIIKEIEELEVLINREPQILYPKELLEKNKFLIQSQNLLKEDAHKFKQQLKELARKSFIVTSKDIELVKNSILSMEKAKFSLEILNFPSCLDRQKEALNFLLQLKFKFENDLKDLSQLLFSSRKYMGEEVQYKNFSIHGILGISTERILLPQAKDYIPPKELREDIIKTLTEKYPEQLKQILQSYLKELIK